MRAILALALTLAAPVSAAGGDVVLQAQGDVEYGLTFDGYGVICQIETEGQRIAPDTESGVVNVVPQGRTFDVLTNVVPAEPGISFGIRTGGTAPALWAARVEVTHPPMGVQGITQQGWDYVPGDPSLNLFTFEYPYEAVKGEWTFRILAADGTVLAVQLFAVTDLSAAPAVAETCFAAEFTS
ncbi:DUF3859 domain-containing protein [Citreimonas salinaria]|uniref:DUF3859 domain-containing protein n=1 Tax=Citreimonas salinaria TaxID=321339 RepID=A0A1H3HNH0_9RHOB|nr:DUF3859 domain-containing protein [Citreimonas salinaria]SDY16930.1 protein of unknown function [Citreimonas salinaria]